MLEKLFIERLDNFIEKHELLTDSQHGFRTNRSTSLALIELIEEITNCIDKKKYAVGVFIDLKKHLIPLIMTYYSTKWKGMVLEGLC